MSSVEKTTVDNKKNEIFERLRADQEFLIALEKNDFSGLTMMTEKRAKALSEIEIANLDLSSMTYLSDDHANILVEKSRGSLILDGLTKITERLATSLAMFEGDTLSLCGLESLTTAQAEVLVKFSGKNLILNGLKSFSEDQTAIALSKFSGERLILDKLRATSARHISSLMNFRGKLLSLNGISLDSEKQVRALANFSGDLLGISKEDLVFLARKSENVLKNVKGKIFITLEELTFDQVKAISRYRGTLEIPLYRYSSLTDEQVLFLSGLNRNELKLNSVLRLTNEQARTLSKFRGNKVYLDGLIELSDEQAEYLVTLRSNLLSLNGLQSITAEQAKAFAKFKGNALLLNGLKSIDTEEAEELVKFRGKNLELEGVGKITANVAKALTEFKGNELRVGLITLNDEIAEILSNYKCHNINMYNLDPRSAKLFLRCRYKIEKKRKETIFNINITCPDCKEWNYCEVKNTSSMVKCTCDACKKEFNSIVVTFLSKRSKKLKEGRKFSIGYKDFSGNEEFIEFVNTTEADYEFHIGDLVVFSWFEKELRIIQNETKKKEYYLIPPSSSCYIATYIYGPNSSEVVYLKKIRDDFLLQNSISSLLVRLYYWLSPKLIHFWGGKKLFKVTCRYVIDTILIAIKRCR